ncbi:MAG: uroporphyrinogen decarboxylase [Spirochaetia bacterium]|nr:uroporphyrinogen decarboxylase [Spirochaetia bacterium]
MTILEKTLRSEKTNKVPIWFMRQAGRYLPEYRELKKERDFMELVMDSDAAAEITLQPVKRLDVDAAIIFSDILVILHALDMGVSFANGLPELSNVVNNEKDVDRLISKYNADDLAERLQFYSKALKLVRADLSPEKTLIGFAAAPFTLASYMIEGKTSKTHAKTRAWMYGNPRSFAKLMDFIVKSTIDYLQIQIRAGANVIQLFDSWGDAMATDVYGKSLRPYIEKISQAVSREVPVIYFCRGASIHREALGGLYNQGVSALSLDWRMPIDFYGESPVQGNLDPAALLSDPETVARMTKELLNARGRHPGYIFNLGHGIYPETPMENVMAMLETVKNFKPEYK